MRDEFISKIQYLIGEYGYKFLCSTDQRYSSLLFQKILELKILLDFLLNTDDKILYTKNGVFPFVTRPYKESSNEYYATLAEQSAQQAEDARDEATIQAGIATVQAGLATAAASSISPVTISTPPNGLAIDYNQVLSLAVASGSQTGALSSTDWTNFNAVESIIQALGSISGTVTINLALGTLITATLTGATTLAFSGLPPSGRETAFTLRFSGIHAITLPVGTKYPAGAVPVPAGALYEIPCTINNEGELIVYGVINDIKTP
jgi:hypothetical protein